MKILVTKKKAPWSAQGGTCAVGKKMSLVNIVSSELSRELSFLFVWCHSPRGTHQAKNRDPEVVRDNRVKVISVL